MKAEIVDLLSNSPGLKGREIANKLGLEKKEVNSFLYGDHSGTFNSQSNRWYLSKDNQTIIFTKSGWLTAADFEGILSRSDDLWSDTVKSVQLEFTDCAILLSAITRMLCLVNQLAVSGKEVTLDFSGCSNSFSYLCRVGLFETLDESVVVIPKVQDHSCHYGKNSKVMEFVCIPAGTQQTDLPAKLKKSFVELAGEQYANTAFGFIAEFINNIIEHSFTPIPGVAALQVYGKNRRKVQTVFSDSGKGIIGTLRPVLKERYPQLYSKYPEHTANSNVFLLEEVLREGGVSGANDENFSGRGLGLKLSAKQAAKFDATVCVRQETFELTLEYRDGRFYDFNYCTDLKKLMGTHICFDFYLD